MGLTGSSTGRGASAETELRPGAGGSVIALAGNPNVGKSSLFNALTGLHQHTGNWPGKTVAVAQGEYAYAAARYVVTDLPGAYSLTTGSEEEHIAVDYLRAHTDACLVAVCDATCLARSLPGAQSQPRSADDRDFVQSCSLCQSDG